MPRTFRPTLVPTLAALALALAGSLPAQAQNIDKLKQMKVSGTDLNIPPVPQTGPQADAIRKNLEKVKLPPGFRISLYAVVPDARHMAVAPSTNMLFVGTRKTAVYAVTDRLSTGTASEVKAFAPSLNFKVPNGVCWTRDGSLLVAEHNRVLMFPAAEFFYEGPDVAVAEVVPQGQLIPVEEESFNHGARTCRVGPDNMLYITLGQPFNVQPREKLKLYEQVGIGGIVRMGLDGSKREVFARGIRNSVGMDFNAKDKSLWFTDNQTDGMGDDIPKGEINRATQAGQFFGYPYIVAQTRIPENGYDKDPIPAGAVNPQVMTDAHAADLGIVYYGARQFPAKYQGGFFSAQHGSWNRTKPVGARVLFTSLKQDGTADKTEVFADGWLDNDTGVYRGRPVDVAVMKDGSLLVSDDFAGAIYRITYSAP
ncbi:PQQ-dependent sugar dehydrogenase [Aquincola tertiaricarbonis]|uniref:PQQ-dependent sugar dehydrogenase n=1 Tax=Aquincola tertiaricarbonis TaxID=391953 RepID=A0ABY4RZ68_AQUTE|nr:PQQ-dependent sugar dehydrogenase [Aquincola tertiaricarbonis]URI06181.1 PQQ-dependent sugar dehydrogenase [Aquincola tertiaricarbonis]